MLVETQTHLLKEGEKNNMACNSEDILLLLLSIKHNGDPSFVKKYITFGTVGYLCSEAIKQGYIIENRKELELTDKGLLFIDEMNKQLNKKGVDKEIASLPNAYITKISIDDVYLPENI